MKNEIKEEKAKSSVEPRAAQGVKSEQERVKKVIEILEKEYKLLKRGDAMSWFAGWRYTGYQRIRWNGRELRYEGHDGTGNHFFFNPFNRHIDIEDAVQILYNKLGINKAKELYVRYVLTQLKKKNLKYVERALRFMENEEIDDDKLSDIVNDIAHTDYCC